MSPLRGKQVVATCVGTPATTMAIEWIGWMELKVGETAAWQLFVNAIWNEMPPSKNCNLGNCHSHRLCLSLCLALTHSIVAWALKDAASFPLVSTTDCNNSSINKLYVWGYASSASAAPTRTISHVNGKQLQRENINYICLWRSVLARITWRSSRSISALALAPAFKMRCSLICW